MTPLTIPSASYPTNTPLADLRTAELLLVTTLRLYALQLGRSYKSCPDWKDGLRAANTLPWTAAAFQGLLLIVTASSAKPLDVRCMHSPLLGYDEGRLLQLVSLYQRNQPEDAAGILAEWLPPAAVRRAKTPAEALAAAFAEADLIIPCRSVWNSCTPSEHQLKVHPGLSLVQ